jgi:hypothetical protein
MEIFHEPVRKFCLLSILFACKCTSSLKQISINCSPSLDCLPPYSTKPFEIVRIVPSDGWTEVGQLVFYRDGSENLCVKFIGNFGHTGKALNFV